MTLERELPNLKVVKFDSFEYLLSSLRPIKNVILVGHGNENGMIVQGNLISWKETSKYLNSFSVINQVHFLSCDSYKIRSFTEDSNLGLTFAGAVDGTVAAMAVSTVIDVLSGRFQKGIDRIKSIFQRESAISNGLIDGEFLYFGIAEKIGHTAMGLFYASLLLLNVYIPSGTWSSFAETVYHVVEASLELIHISILAYEALETANHLLHIIQEANDHGDLLGFLSNNLSWQDYLAAAALIASFAALAFFTSGASEVARVSAYLASMGYWAIKLDADISDCDNEFYDSESCSSPDPPGPWE